LRRACLAFVLSAAFTTAPHAQRVTYLGVIVRDRDTLTGDTGSVRRIRVSLSGTARHTRIRVQYGQSRADSVSGWAVRWGDTLFAVMPAAFGDTAIWLGVRRGRGFVGQRLIIGGPEFLSRARFTINLASGDPLSGTRVPSARSRDSMNAYLVALSRRIERQRPASPASPPTRPSSTNGDWFGTIVMLVVFGPYILGILVLIVKRARVALGQARARWLLARARWREIRSAARVRYSVPCPICRAAQMEAAQEYFMVRGRGLFTSLDRHVVFGCERCVRRAGFGSALVTMRDGTWSLGGVIAAPCAALLDVMRAYGLRDRTLVERLLREAGLEPMLVRLDEDGLVPADRAKLNTHLWICARIMWADGAPRAKVRDEAIQFLIYGTEGRLKRARLEQLLTQAGTKLAAHRAIAQDERATLYRLVKRLVIEHGEFSAAMSSAVHEIAALIGLSRHDLTELLREITESLRASAASKAGASAGAGARANAGSSSGPKSGANSGAKSGPHGDANAGRRRHRPVSAEELAHARAVLNVSSTATPEEIERAYRTVISIWHPDRAGLDPRRQKEFTVRSQEIMWAKEALRRAAQAQAVS